MLAWLAAQTSRIDVGSAVMQIPARTPALTAMTAASLDLLSGGRFRLGLGVSGPQVSEGWHGVRFSSPLGRTREYITVVRTALARQTVVFQGDHYQLPLPDGPGKPLKLTITPVTDRIPIYLAAVGPKNLELAGELSDGWLAVFYAPDYAAEQLDQLRIGRAKVGKSLDGFDVVPSVPVVVGGDPRLCADAVRPYAALYIGGMGSREKNFYNALPYAWGLWKRPPRCRTSTSTVAIAKPWPQYPSTSSIRHHCWAIEVGLPSCCRSSPHPVSPPVRSFLTARRSRRS